MISLKVILFVYLFTIGSLKPMTTVNAGILSVLSTILRGRDNVCCG